MDYFPFDVDFFNDEKIGAISGEFGIKGELACIKLLCAIYRNGYFAVWNEMLRMKLIKELPGVSANLLDEIVSRAVRWGLFDKALFDDGGILTSDGIQRRYFEITKRRISTYNNLPYLLVSVCNNEVNVSRNEVNAVSVCNNEVSAYINPQSKVNKNKKKKIKKEKNTPPIFKPPTVDEVAAYCLERKNTVDANRFVDFYASKGWMVGKNKMYQWI